MSAQVQPRDVPTWSVLPRSLPPSRIPNLVSSGVELLYLDGLRVLLGQARFKALRFELLQIRIPRRVLRLGKGKKRETGWRDHSITDDQIDAAT